jgi:hypothetical protein
MTTKLKSKKRRVKVQEIPKQTKALTGKEQKKIKGGLLPYIEQDNLIKPTNIKDGTSNTIIKN